MDFGLMFFASTEETLDSTNRYQLITECARYGDKNNFSSIWVPERHFTKFGCLYPNPAVLQAALATITKNIQLRAGSVVIPLHNPIRIAEEWAMVDNLSNGRVGISVAPGWNPNDFALFPERYENRREFVLEGLDQIQKLWAGGKITALNGKGISTELELHPKPIQSRLPIWITAATNPETFIKAAELGANLLTHTLDQNIEELGQKIQLYRDTMAKYGLNPADGKVSVMLHTFVGKDFDTVVESARKPYCDYLKANSGLLKSLATSRGNDLNISEMSDDDLGEFINYLYERFATERGLIGTPESCLPVVKKLEKAGIDEIACLMDFGPDTDQVLNNLPYLNQLRQIVQGEKSSANKAPEASPRITVTAGAKNTIDLETIKDRCSEVIAASDFYDEYTPEAIKLGRNFRNIKEIRRNSLEALGQIQLQDNNIDLISSDFQFHPALLDSCLRIISVLENKEERSDSISYELSGFKGLKKTNQKINGDIWSYAELITKSATEVKARLYILDDKGVILLKIETLTLKKIQSLAPKKNDAYQLYWKEEDKKIGEIALAKEDLWVVFNDYQGVGDALIATLQKQNIAYLEVNQGREWQQNDSKIQLNPSNKADFQKLADLSNSFSAKKGKLVYLWGLNISPADDLDLEMLGEYWDESLSGGLHLLQAFHTTNSPIDWKAWLITQGTQIVEGTDVNSSFMQAPLWGLGRSASSELAEIWGGLVDMEPGIKKSIIADQLLSVVSQDGSGYQLTVRDGKSYELQLRAAPQNPNKPKSNMITANASYLITGGRGGLGLKCAEWLVDQGAKNLVLVGRSKPNATAKKTIRQLQSRDCHVELAYTDITDEQQVQQLITEIGEKLPPLKGIFHLAVILDDGSIELQDFDRFRRVTQPKLEGTWNLHQATGHLNLDIFANFSSISSVMPGHGQAAYASANTFLDSIAHYRQSLGLNSLSVNWGPWDNVGTMATEQGKMIRRTLASEGVNTIDIEDGFRMLNGLMESEDAQMMAINFNEDMLEKGEGIVGNYLDKFGFIAPNQETNESKSTFNSKNKLLSEWENLSEEDLYQEIETFTKNTIAEVLKVNTNIMESEQMLNSMGMDSLMAIETRNRIQRALSVQISIVKFMQAATVQKIADELYQQIVRTYESGKDTSEEECPIGNHRPDDLDTDLQEQLLDLDSLMEEELDGIIGKLSN